MYISFKISHNLTALLSLVFSLLWTIVAWRTTSIANRAFGGKVKAFYVANRVTAGLAGVTGLVVTFVGPWRYMIFPYIGLAAFVAHGVATAWSKRYLGTGGQLNLRMALLAQNAALLLAAYVMAVKAF